MTYEIVSTGIGDINEAIAGGVVLIQTPDQAGQMEWAGTGFIFKNDAMTFLITARHVLDPTDGSRIERISIRIRSNLRYPFEGRDVNLPLWDGDSALFRRLGDSPADVAALRLDATILEGRYPFSFTPEHLVPDDLYLPLGGDVVIPGYPEGQYDVRNYLPLVRRGAFASRYGIPFNGEQSFRVDAHLRLGMSGAPVLTKADSWLCFPNEVPRFIGTPVSFLLGVHSEGVDPAGIHNAWYPWTVLALTVPLDLEGIRAAHRSGGIAAAQRALEQSTQDQLLHIGERPKIRFQR